MKEDFLHYLWASGKLPPGALYTTKGKAVVVKDAGMHNTNAGPDFLNAAVYIDDTLWSGHIEMHLRSSFWYGHGHQKDENYSNVILHVVWEHDREVYYPDGSILPVLQLSGITPISFLQRYEYLSRVNSRRINCSGQHGGFGSENWSAWVNQLFTQRLEDRFSRMLKMAPELRTHWEELLFRAVFRYMGARVNADSFYSIAGATGIEKVRKIRCAGEDLEIVFHGMAGFYRDSRGGDEYRRRKKEFGYLRKKYQLSPEQVVKPVFFRLRPPSFPTIRLSQLAKLYSCEGSLFSRVLGCDTLKEMRKVFDVEADPFWHDRYTYGSAGSASRPKSLSVARTDLLLINAVFPVLYAYYRNRGSSRCHSIAKMAAGIRAERNKTLEILQQEGFPLKNAFHSQGLLQLYNEYCSANRCMQCKVGQFIIGG